MYFRYKLQKIIGIMMGIIIILISFFYFFQFRAPGMFPSQGEVSVGNGKSLSEIASELKAKHVIRSTFWFTNFVILLKHERQIVGGGYYFDAPLNVYQVARRITSGAFNAKQVKTTIPEGSTIFDISEIVKKNYPNFDTDQFISLARAKEGYLFPDTYYFGADIRPQHVIEIMTTTFDKKMKQPEVEAAIGAFGKTQEEVITMASILEGEARQTKTRQIVAGILWKRIRLGIPLQVDAAFRYVNGKTTEELTLDDLKIDSPYNTYVYKGLPPTPISSPGLDSIMAAVTPIKTDYLYFLTDKNGKMHYARTLDEHIENRQNYLP
jgi:UPF0755 protein